MAFPPRGSTCREANFWQPSPVGVAQDRGTPWVLKVRGSNRIGGYGFFSYYTVMPSGVAWETFGPANGVESYDEMLPAFPVFGTELLTMIQSAASCCPNSLS